MDLCALNIKFLLGISLDSGGDQHQTVLAAEVLLREMPTWPSSASVFESRVQGADFWVVMGVKQKLMASPHKHKPNENKRFPNDHTTI